MENEIVRFPDMGLHGRRKIKTNVREITKENVQEVLGKALVDHNKNAFEIQYLWNYYCGVQDIRFKQKVVRDVINNKVTVNHANEIVVFKTAYILNEPITYISHDGKKTDEIVKLNEMMRAEDKESKDKEIITWMHICGLGERLTLTDGDTETFYVYTMDPKEAFVIYSSRIGNRPMAGVLIQKDENDNVFYVVYTVNKCFTVKDNTVTEEDHILGGIPLIEYENNTERMGAFETVIPVLNAINQLESDAVDAVQDFVNGFDVFQNCEISAEDYQSLGIGGQAVLVKSAEKGMEASVYRVATELTQEGVQKRIDDLKEDYLSICGMPNRNGGSSTSDTGVAVIFRDGWSEAESRAKDTEKLFNRSERQFLKIVLSICEGKTSLGLELKDIGVNFARKALNNVQSRLQCLVEALNSTYIHPMDAFNAFGDIFGDKTAAYLRGMEWHEILEAVQNAHIEEDMDTERERIANESV